MAAAIDACANLRKQISERLSSEERGNRKATAEAILKIVDAEDPPLRFALGAGCCPGRVPLMLTA